MPRLVVRPLERFLELEAGSAAPLLLATIVALVWANVAGGSYEDLWSTKLSVTVGDLSLEEDLRHLVNDLLMAVFFFVVTLEVKRELVTGSLRDPRRAAVPVAAALGTMVGAASAYLAINLIGDGNTAGWAIPIATDIAFAIGALGLAGKRATAAQRAFLLTLAVVDDLATIVVIAVAFTSGISFAWLAAAAGIAALIAVAARARVRSMPLYVLLAGGLWLAVFESGVHATIAGVIVGFLTPALALHARDRAGEVLADRLEATRDSDLELSAGAMLDVSRIATESVSPLTRMHERLHPWSAFVVLPLFALANAGVPVSLDALGDAVTGPVGLGIILGLVVGAPVAGVIVSWATVKSRLARMPHGLDWSGLISLAPLKGIGFTVAIFIAELAFEQQELRDQAKVAILIASAIAAAIGLACLRLRGRFARQTDATA